MDRLIIGLTGAFGCGTSFLAENFFVKMGYEKCSLSTFLKDSFKTKFDKEPQRSDLQEYGNELREKDASFLAKKLDDAIISKNQKNNYVIESIRNPSEINYFRNKYPEFILIGVFADYDVRWKRVKDSYNNSKDRFDADEQRDKGISQPSYGQRISDCFFESDLIISNNDTIFCSDDNDNYQKMYQKIEAYLKALKNPTISNPTLVETLMAAAYTSGRRSRCYKRKVGAVIADKYDRIISSGFNGVPFELKECKSSLGMCYRDKKREEFGTKLSTQLNSKEEH